MINAVLVVLKCHGTEIHILLGCANEAAEQIH